VYVELTPEVIEQAKQFAKDRGEKFRDVVETALRRHMAFPSPVPAPVPPSPPPPPPPVPPPHPFPDVPPIGEAEVEPERAASPTGKKGRGAGGKSGGRGTGKK
jgi:hypothetical protein